MSARSRIMGYESWGDIVTEGVRRRGSLVVGIDPVYADIPECFKSSKRDPVQCLRDYSVFLIDTIAVQAGFIKPQSAFFEAFGSPGVDVLARVMAYARQKGLRIILDAKRGDISSTAAAYAHAYLSPESGSDLEVDCMTVNPFLGTDTVEPFLECVKKYGKGLFVLVKTSNAGGGWIQDLAVDGKTVSERIAAQIDLWSQDCTGSSGLSSIGAVVGATFPEQGIRLRDLMPRSVFLLPGIGAQGGDVQALNSLRRGQEETVLVPISRGITKVENISVPLNEYRKTITERIKSFQTTLKMDAEKEKVSC
jgi:orotidine-5'-phosphate decarboxylase